MSLLDVYDKLYGGSFGSGSSGVAAPKRMPLSGGGATYASGEQEAANSRQRGAPERIDVNDFVDGFAGALNSRRYAEGSVQEKGLQALEVVGKAPGFIAERPFAIAQTAIGQVTGGKVDIEDAVGHVPIVGDLIGGAGDILHNVSTFVGGIANQSMAESLKQGTLAGLTDDTLMKSVNPVGLGEEGGGFLGLRVGDRNLTWGQFKDEARRKGWTGQDIQDLIDGKKANTDFGDRAFSSDPLTEAALRFGSDPTNLLFGAGVALKAGRGIGLLGKMIAAGAELQKPLAVAAAAEKAAEGVGVGATWLGLAKYAGTAGRGLAAIPGGAAAVEGAARGVSAAGKGLNLYRKAAYATTAGQLGISALDSAAQGIGGENNPISGFLEPLFELNQKALDNQPLSKNDAFALFTAFHLNAFHYIGQIKEHVKATNYYLRGSGVRGAVIDALGEGWGKDGGKAGPKDVLGRLGGKEALDNLIVHVGQRMMFQDLIKIPAIKTALERYDSLSEAALANAKVGDIVRTNLVHAFKTNAIRPADFVNALKDWHGYRDEINDKGIAFPWHGQHAIDRWVEYSGAAAPLESIFRERAAAVIGLADAPIKTDYVHMGAALKIAAKDGQVPINDVRSWLSRYPQLVKGYRQSWEKYLGQEFDGQTVELTHLQGKLRKAIGEAPDARELTHESAAAERGAAKPTLDEQDLAGPEGSLAKAYDDGTVSLSASRMRPGIARRLKLANRSTVDVMRSRMDPAISTFEENVGDGLRRAGFHVDAVSQSIGSWRGAMEPSVEIQMAKATLPEARLAAATLGRVGKQDAITLSFSGPAMARRGLVQNGHEYVIHLPTVSRAVLDHVGTVLRGEFDGYTLNDTTGVVRILMKEADRPKDMHLKMERVQSAIESVLPKDLIGDSGLRTSAHPAYIEMVGQRKEPWIDATYHDVIRDARRGADPRADAHQALAAQVARRRAPQGDAPAGLGRDEAVGRQPGADVGANGDLALPPAERVGIGEAVAGPVEPGYLYHVTDRANLVNIADQGLKPFGPEERGGTKEWGTGGQGRRAWFHDKEIPEGAATGAVVRVRDSAAGRVRRDVAGVPYTQKTIAPSDLEILGADGAWHPADKFFEPELPEHLVEPARAAEPAYQAPKTGEFDPRPDPLTQGLRAAEDGAWGPKGVPGDEAALRAELVKLTRDDAKLGPEDVQRAQQVQRQLEQSILAKGQVRKGDVLYAAQRDAEVASRYPLHRSLADRPELMKAELRQLDENLRLDYGTYQLKAPPKLALFFERNQGELAADYLRERTKLGEILAGNGPLSPVSHFVNWLTEPVHNDRLAKEARQALMNKLLPHGAKPEEVSTFIERLRAETQRHTVGKLEIQMFGQITSMTQQAINKMAAEVFGPKVVASVGKNQFARILDQSSNRFIRATDAKMAAGRAGALERGLNRIYKTNQQLVTGDISRFASKTMYHIFRFISDARWWAMNMVEADFIGGARYGLDATRIRGANKAEPGLPAVLHSSGAEAAARSGQNGWLWSRHHAGYISKAFDSQRPETTLTALRDMPKNDPALGELQRMFGDSEPDIVAGIDRLLYNIDKKGAKATITEEAQQHLGIEETQRLAPFLEQVWRRNDELFHSIEQTFNGNPSRTNLERIGNSYWLYWPLSYQVKATKWLVDVMTHQFAGHETNLAPAALYAHYYEEHKKRMATNTAYQAMFEDHPTMWFLAQMLFPVTPGDIGVSLSRIPRYVGGELGIWGEYKAADDPGAFLAAVTSLGPTYTGQLLERVGREAIANNEANLYPEYHADAESKVSVPNRRQQPVGLGG